MPAELDIHLIVDNYSTHKSAEVQRWLRPKKTPPLPFSLHPNQQFLAQPGGTLVWTDY